MKSETNEVNVILINLQLALINSVLTASRAATKSNNSRHTLMSSPRFVKMRSCIGLIKASIFTQMKSEPASKPWQLT